MDIKLAQTIIDATIQNGGYTYTSKPGRYVVGTGIGFITYNTVTVEDLERIIEMCKEHDCDGFGTWVHEGITYLDLIKTYGIRADAYKAARAHNEIAFYDRLEQKEHKV